MSAPSKAVCDAVDRRDDFRCQRCGASLQVTSGSRHHRMRRRDGGHSPAQLILLCGSGTTGCHGWVHSHPAAARALGLIVPALRRPPLEPDEVPVKVFGAGWVLLKRDGTRERVLEAVALELLALFGMREAA